SDPRSGRRNAPTRTHGGILLGTDDELLHGRVGGRHPPADRHVDHPARRLSGADPLAFGVQFHLTEIIRQVEEVLAEVLASAEHVAVALAVEGGSEHLDDLAGLGLVAVELETAAIAGPLNGAVTGQVAASLYIRRADA